MIPIKDKKYMINCQGPYDYNRYMGEGVFTGEVEDGIDFLVYGFKIPTERETCWFLEEEIVGEIASDGKIKTEESVQEQIDSENHYCETCGSCGESGCCPPINCQAVKCKYGEINLKDYKCFQNQWGIMHNALKELADFDGNKIAINALNAVDKEWDKLYSKENND